MVMESITSAINHSKVFVFLTLFVCYIALTLNHTSTCLLHDAPHTKDTLALSPIYGAYLCPFGCSLIIHISKELKTKLGLKSH
jgi:hypothetical protein